MSSGRKTDSVGVVYIATGDQYITEAEYSAKSVRNHMPDLEIAIATDHSNIDQTLFDYTVGLSNKYPDSGVSTITPELSPFDRTLFLDTDTYVAKPVYELFDILDEHEIAVTQSPGGLSVPGVPDPWTEYNTGVISYKSTEKTKEFFRTWARIHEDLIDSEGITRNQPSFAKSLYSTGINYFVLPREYNCRVPRLGYVADEAKIIHGRYSVELSDIASKMNNRIGPRIYWPKIRFDMRADINMLSRSELELKPRHLVFKFQRSVRRSGIRHALKETYKEVQKLLKNGN